MSKQPTFTKFDQTVLELVAQAKDGNEAVTYVQDWQNCTRAEAMQYITDAKLSEKAIKAEQR